LAIPLQGMASNQSTQRRINVKTLTLSCVVLCLAAAATAQARPCRLRGLGDAMGEAMGEALAQCLLAPLEALSELGGSGKAASESVEPSPPKPNRPMRSFLGRPRRRFRRAIQAGRPCLETGQTGDSQTHGLQLCGTTRENLSILGTIPQSCFRQS